MMAPNNAWRGNFTGYRSRGFIANRSSGFVNNRSPFSNYRSTGFVNNRSNGFFVKRQSRGLSNYGNRTFSDARQILEQKKRMRGSVPDLSQNLVSRAGNSAHFLRRSGFVTKPRYTGQFNRNNSQNFKLNHRAVFNRENLRSEYLPRNKFVQVHRRGITVVTKQHLFQQNQMPFRDELEDMTLDNLPQLECAVPSQSLNPSLEAHLQHSNLSDGSGGAVTVLVSNLKQSVTEEDICELFSVVGQMTSVQLAHPGTALVTYADEQNALTAVEHYNNITLDGMAMRCTIISLDKQITKPSITSRLGDRTSTPLTSQYATTFSSRVPTVMNFSRNFGTPNSGRQVQALPPFVNRMPRKPKFTVCLN